MMAQSGTARFRPATAMSQQRNDELGELGLLDPADRITGWRHHRHGTCQPLACQYRRYPPHVCNSDVPLTGKRHSAFKNLARSGFDLSSAEILRSSGGLKGSGSKDLARRDESDHPPRTRFTREIRRSRFAEKTAEIRRGAGADQGWID